MRLYEKHVGWSKLLRVSVLCKNPWIYTILFTFKQNSINSGVMHFRKVHFILLNLTGNSNFDWNKCSVILLSYNSLFIRHSTSLWSIMYFKARCWLKNSFYFHENECRRNYPNYTGLSFHFCLSSWNTDGSG